MKQIEVEINAINAKKSGGFRPVLDLLNLTYLKGNLIEVTDETCSEGKAKKTLLKFVM